MLHGLIRSSSSQELSGAVLQNCRRVKIAVSKYPHEVLCKFKLLSIAID